LLLEVPPFRARVVKAIKETIHLMAEVDKAIPKWPIE
jgi:hypothetical protein